MKQTCDLLLVMCQDRASPMVVKYMDAAVQLMVAASRPLRCKQTSFLHLLVNAWSKNATRRAYRQPSSSFVHLGMFSSVEYLVKEFLYTGADPNAVDDSDKTGAHCVIESCRGYRRLPVEEGLALLNLFDEYGIHWDAFHGRKQSLVELVEKVRGMESLATQLQTAPGLCRGWPRKLSACQLDYSELPKRMQLLVDIHKPQLPLHTTVAEKYLSVQRSWKASSSSAFRSFGRSDVDSDDCMCGGRGYSSDHYGHGCCGIDIDDDSDLDRYSLF